MNMKKTIKTTSILVGIILFFNSSALTAQTKDYKRYKLKSAIIKFQQSGTLEGTAILYFDDYGMKEATHEEGEMAMFGIKQESKTVNYLHGFMQYNMDMINKTATKTKNTILQSLVENSESSDLEEIGMEMFKQMGGEKVGKEDIIGKPCEIWELKQMGTKVWIWNGIPLRTETDMMGIKLIKVATNIKANVSIPPDKIEIPPDIEFKEIDMGNLNEMIQQYSND